MRTTIYGLVAGFDTPGDLVRAGRAARQAGYRKMDAFSPFPIEELSEALGLRWTGMPLIMFIGGLIGCIAGFSMQYYCSVISYPLNVGGRPLNSWPAFIPVTFELTVLLSGLAGTLGLLGLCGLPKPYHPLFHVPSFARATQDRFFMCIEATDPRFNLETTRRFLATLEPKEIAEVPH